MTDQLALLPEIPPHMTAQVLRPDLLRLGVGPSPDKALIESVRRFGILQPILVTLDVFTDGFRVIDGRRRTLAAIEVGLDFVPTIWIQGEANPAAIQLASHALRSRNRAAEIDAIETLIHEGHGIREIGQAVGMTQGEVKALLPLTTLPSPIRQGIREGKISESVAREVARLPLPATHRCVEIYERTGKLRADDVKEQRTARAQAAAASLDLDALAFGIPDAPEIPQAAPARPVVAWAAVLALVEAFDQEPDKIRPVAAGARLARQLRAWAEEGVRIE